MKIIRWSLQKKPKLDAVKLLSLLLIGFLFFSPASLTVSAQKIATTISSVVRFSPLSMVSGRFKPIFSIRESKVVGLRPPDL